LKKFHLKEGRVFTNDWVFLRVKIAEEAKSDLDHYNAYVPNVFYCAD